MNTKITATNRLSKILSKKLHRFLRSYCQKKKIRVVLS